MTDKAAPNVRACGEPDAMEIARPVRGRAGETDRWQQRHGDPVRSHLANQALTRCRQRVHQAQLAHRDWKDGPLFGVRKLLLCAAERSDLAGWTRIHAAIDAGDPDVEVRDCWVAKVKSSRRVSDRRQ